MKISEVNGFSLEFSSALLANLLSTEIAQDYLFQNLKFTKDLLSICLSIGKEKITTLTLYNILLALGHLAEHKERFAGPFDESHFSEKLSDLHEFYQQLNPSMIGKLLYFYNFLY